MPDTPRLTPAQKAAAITRARENIALLSGAGCGKTYVLARRFTELLLAAPDGVEDAESPLARLVALTFTEKAAIEMRQRLHKLLTERLTLASGADRERIARWLEELPEARISTIHSFCSGLLRRYALEAGLDPNFAVCADEMLTGSLRQDAADQALLESVEAQDGDTADLLAGTPYEAVVEWIAQLIAGRTACPLEGYDDPQGILARWQEILTQGRRHVADQLAADTGIRRRLADLEALPCAGGGSDKLESLRNETAALVRAILKHPMRDSFAALAAIKPGNYGSAANWGGKDKAKTARELIKTLRDGLADHAMFFNELGELDRLAACRLSTLTRLARRGLDLYSAEKRSRGLLDFDDLLAHTHRLLSANAAARHALAAQIDQLLIDEAQDTDSLQLDMLERLLFGREQSSDLPDGRLFLVGDSKQSIYRFRGARVDIFNNLVARLGPGRTETLDVSFRTHRPGVQFVNHLFEPLMGPEYAPTLASRCELPEGPSVEILLAGASEYGPVADMDSAVAAQAALTAQRIAEMIAAGERRVWDPGRRGWRGVRAGDIAILLGRMSVSGVFERELALRNVPFYVVGGTGFFQMQEVFDILNALRAIDNPLDDIALVGTLRSSLFGLDDDALVRLASRGPTPWFHRLAQADDIARLDDLQRASLRRAHQTIARLHARKNAVGIDRLIEETLQATGYEAVLLSQFQGKRMLGNVRHLVEKARSASAEGLSLAAFVTQMDQMTMSESRYEQATVTGEQEDVVRIMTVHKAKGLEFPVVFLPDLNCARRPVRQRLLARGDWGLTFNATPMPDGGAQDETDDSDSFDDTGSPQEQPLSHALAHQQEDADDRAEHIRRLYVAVTRHEDYLVLVGADWRNKDGSALQRAGSYLAILDGILNLSGIEGEQARLNYADGQFHAVFKRLAAQPAPRHNRARSAGERLLREAAGPQAFAAALAGREAHAAPGPLLGPLDARLGRAELAVTALADFDHCPALYRWRHELRLPDRYTGGVRGAPSANNSLDPATLGTIYHRAMELLDFHTPQPPAEMVARVLAEQQIDADPAPLAAELVQMIARLAGEPLWRELGSAGQIYREMDFVLDAGVAELRGQIDLLYQDARGAWHIVDYKSDRVGREGLLPHAQRYELQMLVYAVAAGRHFNAAPADACLYFLRPGQTHTFALGEARFPQARQRVGDLAQRLVAAQRTGRFDRAEGPHCPQCPYAHWCEAIAPDAGAGPTGPQEC